MPAMEQRIGKPGDPCAMVIFGASGDLTRRKLIPALYNLAKNELLSREFAVIGVARSPMSTEEYRKKVSEDIKQFATDKVDPDIWEWFVRRMLLSERRHGRQESLPSAERSARQSRQRPLHPRQSYVLHGHCGRFFRARSGATGRSRPDAARRPALAAGGHRKTFRTRSRIRPAC